MCLLFPNGTCTWLTEFCSLPHVLTLVLIVTEHVPDREDGKLQVTKFDLVMPSKHSPQLVVFISYSRNAEQLMVAGLQLKVNCPLETFDTTGLAIVGTMKPIKFQQSLNK